MTDAGWAAIGAVSGALVGASAGGLVDWGISRWRERRQAQAGARLVAADIAEADQTFLRVEKDKEWNAETKFIITSWDEYRSVLATHLDRDAFDAVSRAVAVLRSFNYVVPERIMDKVPPAHTTPLPKETLEGVATMRERLAVAYNALAELGDLEKAGDRIRPGGGALVEALGKIAAQPSGDT